MGLFTLFSMSLITLCMPLQSCFVAKKYYLGYDFMLYNAVKCNAIQYNTIQYNTIHFLEILVELYCFEWV